MFELGSGVAQVGDRGQAAAHVGFSKGGGKRAQQGLEREQIRLAPNSIEDETWPVITPGRLIDFVAVAKDKVGSGVCRLDGPLRPGKVATDEDV